MIQFSKKINVYSYIISDIYCCDCFFDRIASLINSLKEFTECDEFINILENEFLKKVCDFNFRRNNYIIL